MGGKRMASQRQQMALGLGLLALLVLLALFQDPADDAEAYDLDSAAPDGLRALSLWLQDMGYEVERTGPDRFSVLPETDLLFIFPSQRSFEIVEATVVRNWIDKGGTLVLIGSAANDVCLTEIFDTVTVPAWTLDGTVQQVQPLLPDLASQWVADSGMEKLDLGETNLPVPVLARTSGDVTAAVQSFGRGTVWYLTADHDFVNDSLLVREQAALIPALLRWVPDGGTILFDTYHLYAQREQTVNQIASIQDWLYRTYTGWALLFGIGIVFVFLLLEGWRLGPPLPEQTGVRRREAAEYVAAMAGLQHKAQLGAAVARHHKRRLKVTLGRTYHISPDLADSEFASRLDQGRGSLSPQQIREVKAVLRELDTSTDDKSLIRLVTEVDLLLTSQYGPQP